MIDYQAITDALTPDSIKIILTALDIPFREKFDHLEMPTVCHNSSAEDASWKLYYYFNNKVFMCYTEDGAMSIWKFLRNYYEAHDVAYDWYRDIYLLITNATNYRKSADDVEKYRSNKNKYNVAHNVVEQPEYNSGVLECFTHYYPPEWLEDGISQRAMDKYHICFSISQNKIIIPHYDIKGRLIGIRGRALNADEIEIYGKYAPIWVEGKCFSHQLSMNLYGLYENQDNIRKSGYCILCESEKSVLQAESFARPNCVVGVCGANFNIFQLKLLMNTVHPREIILALDHEEEDSKYSYYNKLYKMMQKYSKYCATSIIYDTNNLTGLKDSPTDNGEEVFEKLLNERIQVK